jgi:hypothetical protein
VGLTVFFGLSAGSVNKEMRSKYSVLVWRKNQVFKSFLLLPLYVLDLKSFLSESIKPDFSGHTKAFLACFLSSYAATVF